VIVAATASWPRPPTTLIAIIEEEANNKFVIIVGQARLHTPDEPFGISDFS
jgi:hypothetical protein